MSVPVHGSANARPEERQVPELNAEGRRVVVAWIDAHKAGAPESVRAFLELHRPYLLAGGDRPSLRRAFDAAMSELRRVLHLTPSSEKRRASGAPLAGIPKGMEKKSAREKLEARRARADYLSGWHRALKRKQDDRRKKVEQKLAKLPKEPGDSVKEEFIPLETEFTDEERADIKAGSARFVEHLMRSHDAPDPALKPVNETLMPGGAVLISEERVSLPAIVPEDLASAEVVKTLHEERVRYDFSVSVTRIVLDVEKKVLVDPEGDRFVVGPSTIDYGPPRYQVTWSALATLTVLVGQFALPFHRLGTLLSTPDKRFTASALSRMLHYVAGRFVPIYLELAKQMANSAILAGDDTSCRVLEVSRYQAKLKSGEISREEPPPWHAYRTPLAAEASFQTCATAQKSRQQRRAEGDREATRTPEEDPSLGVLIGRSLVFESPLRDGTGPKEAMHTTVISGRSNADDPTSLVVFYRSHLGSVGNLLESILRCRDPKLRDLTVQGDLSTTNPVADPDLLARFDIRNIGCTAHARRPFAQHEEEDPMRCSHLLHLFLGLAIHEDQLDVFGRNRDNVLAVRGEDSRELWNDIRDVATDMTKLWSTATTLGTAARYIINHFEQLTAYLNDPRLEPTNNNRERMLRMEKLIEASSMFRRSLEGRFVLDVVRTILQTTVAAGVPVHDYLESVLRAPEDDVSREPSRFTPMAWAKVRNANAPQTAPP